MKYVYTDQNLLHTPQKYTYSQFGGDSFIENYFLSRSSLLERKYTKIKAFDLSKLELNIVRKVSVLLSDIDENENYFFLNLIPSKCPKVPLLVQDLQYSFPNQATIDSLELLDSLLINILSDIDSPSLNKQIHIWVSALVQRFEVTKKLWSQYLPGFRKGHGECHKLVLYQYFSLILAILHYESSDLQYLSTLLKVNDLLLSLDYGKLDSEKGITCWGLAVVLEIFSVKKLQSN